MTPILAELSDDAVNAEAKRRAQSERSATAELLRLLIEVERRGLHLALGHSSMFAYCTRALLLSEQAAYSRITAARAARRYPALLDLLADGSLTLSSVGLLAPHLSDETVDPLLDAARFKSTREVERLIASAFPQPDVAAQVRVLPQKRNEKACESPGDCDQSLFANPVSDNACLPVSDVTAAADSSSSARSFDAARRRAVSPIAPRRYLLRATLSEATHAKLQQARALLRHAIPDGDVDDILGRALSLLVDHALRSKTAGVRRPRSGALPASNGRHVPAAVRRAVWERDGGKCTFAGADGMCGETGFLEFHHVIPFADGGPTSVDNLELRCRAHNAYEAATHFADVGGDDAATRRAPS